MAFVSERVCATINLYVQLSLRIVSLNKEENKSDFSLYTLREIRKMYKFQMDSFTTYYHSNSTAESWYVWKRKKANFQQSLLKKTVQDEFSNYNQYLTATCCNFAFIKFADFSWSRFVCLSLILNEICAI